MITIAALFFIVAVLGLVYFSFVLQRNHEAVKKSVSINGHIIETEISKSFAQLSKGLSGRTSLDEGKGMLFIFNFPAKYGFWMKDMKFPLDMIWIKNGKITGIEKNVLPPPQTGGLKIYYPPGAIDRVLEVNAGESDKIGIKTGDQIEYLSIN
ncbi:MAG: DUF192 domain-containing protein [Candidatus Pacebacteria bacterium]|nr:DUF192 domain-containing protein [Candidatus Paceibacterota bacterium]